MTEANLAETPAPVATPANDVAIDNSVPSTETKQSDAPVQTEKDTAPKMTEAEIIKMRMQKRIDKLTAKSTAAERAYQEAMAKLQSTTQQSTGEPKESDYDTIEDFLIAKGEYKAKTEYEKSKQEEAQKQAQLKQNERIEKLRVTFEQKEAEMRKVTPDYDDTVQVVNDLIEDAPKDSAEFGAFREMLLTAPDMPALVYHLGKNPQIVESLFQMTPAEIAWTMAREAVKLEGASAKQSKSPNPEPPKAVSGSAKPEKSLAQMTAKEIDAWRRSS